MAAAVEEGRATAPVAPASQTYAPPPQPYAQPQSQPQAQPWGGGASQPYRGDDRAYRGDKYRDDRHRDDDYRYKKKKRDSIFDIFD